MQASKSENIYSFITMIGLEVAQTMCFYKTMSLCWVYGFYLVFISPWIFNLNDHVFPSLLRESCFMLKAYLGQNMCTFNVCHSVDSYTLDVH